MSTTPDLCIIGAGALGIDLALHARRLGADVVLAEREQEEPGDGRALALRSASFAESAGRAEDMRRAAEFGIGAPDFTFSPRQASERAGRLVGQRARANAPEVWAASGVTVIRGAVHFIDPRSILVGDLTLRPRAIVLALGGEPIMPSIPGLAEAEFFTADTIWTNQRKLTHLVVIGGDAFALEQAQLQRRLGAEVTLVPHGPLLPGFDAECAAILYDILAEEGVDIRRDAVVDAIRPRSQGIGVDIRLADGSFHALDASHLLVSAGRRVDFAQVDLGKARLKMNEAGDSPMLRGALGSTSSRHIRLVGPEAGQFGWAAAQAHGRAVIDSILGAEAGAPLLPQLVETRPSLAQIGSLGEAADKTRQRGMLLRQSFAENDRAAAMGQERGLAKISVDDRGLVSGAAVLGPMAEELASLFAFCMDQRIGLAGLARLPLPRPSLFEIATLLAETHAAARPVSARTQRARALRRFLRRLFGG